MMTPGDFSRAVWAAAEKALAEVLAADVDIYLAEVIDGRTLRFIARIKPREVRFDVDLSEMSTQEADK